MRKKNLLVVVTALNWLLTIICAYVFVTTPHLSAPFAPSEIVVEPLFTYYRQLGKLILGLMAALLVSALLNTAVLVSNRRNRQTPAAEKVKRTTRNSLEDSYVIVDDEDMETADFKQKRSGSR